MKNATDHERRHEQMACDIIQQIRNAVQDELAGAPASFAFEELERIEESVISETRRVIDELSFEEMQSEAALAFHIANARFDTNRRVNKAWPSAGASVLMKIEGDPFTLCGNFFQPGLRDTEILVHGFSPSLPSHLSGRSIYPST